MNNKLTNLVLVGTSFDSQLAGAYLLAELKNQQPDALTKVVVNKFINNEKDRQELQANYREIFKLVGNGHLNLYFLGVANEFTTSAKDLFTNFIVDVLNRTKDIDIYSFTRFGQMPSLGLNSYIQVEETNEDEMVFTQVAEIFENKFMADLGKAWLTWQTDTYGFECMQGAFYLFNNVYGYFLTSQYDQFIGKVDKDNSVRFAFEPMNLLGVSKANQLAIYQDQVKPKVISKLAKNSYLINNHEFVILVASEYQSELAKDIWQTPNFDQSNLIFIDLQAWGAKFIVRTPETSSLNALEIAQVINKDKAVGNQHAGWTMSFFDNLGTIANTIRTSLANQQETTFF